MHEWLIVEGGTVGPPSLFIQNEENVSTTRAHLGWSWACQYSAGMLSHKKRKGNEYTRSRVVNFVTNAQVNDYTTLKEKVRNLNAEVELQKKRKEELETQEKAHKEDIGMNIEFSFTCRHQHMSFSLEKR